MQHCKTNTSMVRCMKSWGSFGTGYCFVMGVLECFDSASKPMFTSNIRRKREPLKSEFQQLLDTKCRQENIHLKSKLETLPKAQRTRGLSSSFQSNFLKSYQELLHKSWSNFIFRILTKNQVQNLNQDFITVPSCLIQHFRARSYNFQLVQSFC